MRNNESERWKKETTLLREILLECDVRETIKWRKPCFTHQGKNICVIQNMKGFLALLFFKGAFWNDPEGVLEVQGPNSRSDYRMKFTSTQEVLERFTIDPDFKVAFGGLTPGRQRGYILYFSNAKQSATRIRRIEKYRSKILAGKGMLLSLIHI